MQSIIVYRNPIEAAFWEGNIAWPIIVGMFVGGIFAITVTALYQRLYPRSNNSDIVAIVSIVIGMLATIFFMS